MDSRDPQTMEGGGKYYSLFIWLDYLRKLNVARKWIASTFKLCFELWHRPDHLGDGLSELTKAVSLIPMIRYWDKTKAPPKGGHNDLWKTENVLYYREMTPGEVVRNRGTVVGENM